MTYNRCGANNRTGASGIIGTEFVAKSAPDRGQRAEEILREYGYAANEIANFRQQGII